MRSFIQLATLCSFLSILVLGGGREVAAAPFCETGFWLGWSELAADFPEPCRGGDACMSGESPIVAGEIYLNIASEGSNAAEGWTLSIEATGDLDIVSATTAGTVAAPIAEGGRFADGFELTEVIDPAMNSGRRGVISIVALSLTDPVTHVLPAVGTRSVLRLELADAGEGTQLGTLSPTDGLVLSTSGRAIRNTVTHGGLEVPFCQFDFSDLPLNPPVGLNFRRSDTNNDGRVNIADPKFLANFLFLGGPDLPCMASGDTNGDGNLNIADPQYLANFLFLGGPPPPAPFPACDSSTALMDLALGCRTSSCEDE